MPLNKRLKKKLAYHIASMAFNNETHSTYEMLQGDGVDCTLEEAEEITEIVGDLFIKMSERADGWEKAISQ